VFGGQSRTVKKAKRWNPPTGPIVDQSFRSVQILLTSSTNLARFNSQLCIERRYSRCQTLASHLDRWIGNSQGPPNMTVTTASTVSHDSSSKLSVGRKRSGSTSKRRHILEIRTPSWHLLPGPDGSPTPSVTYRSGQSQERMSASARARQYEHHKLKVNRQLVSTEVETSGFMLSPGRPSPSPRRPFDAFVDVPSPFAKSRPAAKKRREPSVNPHDEKSELEGRHLPFIDASHPPSLSSLPDPSFSHSNPLLHSLPVSPTSPPKSSSRPALSPHSPPVSPNSNSKVADSMRFDLNRMPPNSGDLDPSTRATNLEHTRPEWTTWDFVDVIVSNFPRDVKTVDLWNNFKKEGELSSVEIFSDTRGEKTTKGKLRFRQVTFDSSVVLCSNPPGKTTTEKRLFYLPVEICSHLERHPTM
jgi:hypothetical protein